ncbi:MAG: PSD1 and planctomycete cytochrome C domain-containing protein [Planctomycetales bacterium]|nr:PSD1 and planctomycete cytochrome C domain-containing protein [Planctomycetales bacterium]
MFRWTPVVNLVCASLFGIPAIEADEALKSVELQQAATADAGKVEFFEAKIRPVLVAHCYACHATDAKDVKGGLLLDSRQGMLVGGDSGTVLVPGVPDASLLLEALRHEGLEMPPDRRLSDAVIADFWAWIGAGAADPRQGKQAPTKRTIDIEHGREFWCFRPIQRPSISATAGTWATTDIDRLIVAQQLAMSHDIAKLGRATEASPEILIRRLTFVLTGLPPTLQEQETFANAWENNPQTAMEATVDRLLASPHFGERWGRHWLDVARFSESTGGGRSLMLPDAWRFRDYVIRAFNTDKPFEQLVREHLAGDLMPSSSDTEHDARVIGVGYLMLGAINYEEQDKEQLRMDVVDEQIDSMGRTFLGMTLGCCRCHDHKFDPIPTTDYYALAGIFRSTKSLLPNNVSDFVTAPLRVGYDQSAMKVWVARDMELEQQIAALKPALPRDSLSQHLKALEATHIEHRKSKPVQPTAMCVRDEETPSDWHVHLRGEIRNLGAMVPRGFLSVATPVTRSSMVSTSGALSSSGRLELAEWVASPSNPLTARVYVNRVWMHVMGEGIVRTPDNFGETGERPTHPELLDYLADSFVTEDAWSTKKLVRRLCLTSAFRMVSHVSRESAKMDPENRSLSRGFRRRLDAESIRDALLQISGSLDLSLQSGCTIPKLSTYDNEFHHDEHPLYCRSVYVPSFRNTMLDVFEVFDVANPNVVTGKRTNSLRPAQSLYMLNSPFVMDQAERAAAMLLKSSSFHPGELSRRIQDVWRICLGRKASAAELTASLQIIGKEPDSERAWSTLWHSLFASVDFRYVD